MLVALAATFGTIVIHGFVVHTIIMTLRRNLQRGVLGARLWVNLTFIMGATLLALAGHLVEIALWAFALDISGAVADISAAIYSSAGSYTTSGSDIVLPPRWKLLGPFEAVMRNVDVRPLDRVYFRRHPTPDFTPGSRARITSFLEDAGFCGRSPHSTGHCSATPRRRGTPRDGLRVWRGARAWERWSR